jgi:hypothetical protein
MPDGTRCDIVTETHAIEVDFADKWAEAIGQCLNYSFQLNKKAGILLKWPPLLGPVAVRS